MLLSAIQQLARDVRVGARMLLKTPLFTIFAALVLSVGVGANVTVFTYLNAIFLKSLNVPEPDRLMRIYGDGEGPNGVVSYSAYLQYRDGNQALSNVGMYLAGGPPIPIRMQGPRTLPIDVMQPSAVSATLLRCKRIVPSWLRMHIYMVRPCRSIPQ